MRLIRYVHNKRESYGILKDDGVIDLPILLRMGGYDAPNTLEAFVSSGMIDEVNHLINELSEDEIRKVYDRVKARRGQYLPPTITLELIRLVDKFIEHIHLTC